MVVDASCVRFPVVTFLLRGDSSHKRSKFKERLEQLVDITLNLSLPLAI